MTEYTFSEARQKLAAILDKARRDGAVRIRRRDGQVFVLKPEKAQKSPFNVPGINLRIGRKEIVDLIKEGRRKVDAG
jgi:antitoxin Phd